jgi:hypothetical protein
MWEVSQFLNGSYIHTMSSTKRRDSLSPIIVISLVLRIVFNCSSGVAVVDVLMFDSNLLLLIVNVCILCSLKFTSG